MKYFIPALLGSLLTITLSAQNDTLIGKVYFNFDQFRLTKNAESNLQQLATVLTEKKGIKLIGRTDDRGSNYYNDTLSLRRISSVASFLQNLGIQSEQIATQSALGKRNPVAIDETNLRKKRELNRMVEIWAPIQDRQGLAASEPVLKSDPPVAPAMTAVKIQEQIKEGKSNIVLNNLNFEGGRHILLPSSQPTLLAVVEVMKNNPLLVVEIRGHICCSAVNEDGLDIDTGERLLSRNRAREIYQLLINNGIAADRLSYRGMGGSQKIIAEESSEEDRTTNRRVEFIIIKR
ncbi:MAG: OmpA family protein [Sediminibacterium sp.]